MVGILQFTSVPVDVPVCESRGWIPPRSCCRQVLAAGGRSTLPSAHWEVGTKHLFSPISPSPPPDEAAASCLWDPDGSMRAAPVGRRLRKKRLWRNGASAKRVVVDRSLLRYRMMIQRWISPSTVAACCYQRPAGQKRTCVTKGVLQPSTVHSRGQMGWTEFKYRSQLVRGKGKNGTTIAAARILLPGSLANLGAVRLV